MFQFEVSGGGVGAGGRGRLLYNKQPISINSIENI